MKKLIILALVLVTLIAVVACATEGAAPPPAATPAADANAATPPPAQPGDPAQQPDDGDGRMFAETFHITWLEEGRPHLYDDNNMVEQAINEMLNVQIEYIQVPAPQFAEQMGIILASRDLPDIINFQSLSALLPDWASQGAIIALDGLLESYGQDIMSHWGPDDWIRVRSAVDGQIYGIPAITDIPGAFSLMYRQDILDDLGLDAPATLDEFMNVLRTVRDEIPDSIPFAGLLRPFQNAFGIESTYFMIHNGSYINRFQHPNHREYMELMIYMYENNLMDPEFFTRNAAPSDVEELFFTGRAFMMEQFAASAETTTRTLSEVTPGAFMQPVDPIIGPYGDQQIMGRNRWMAAGSISSLAARPADLMKVLNWFFTYDGIIMTNFGVEGETFEYIDGAPTLLPEFSNFIESRRVGINKAVAPIVMTTEYFLQSALHGRTPDDLEWEVSLFHDGLTRNDRFIYWPAHTFATPTFARSWETIRQNLLDSEVQTIIGSKSLDDHMALIEAQGPLGLTDILIEMNEAYDRVR